MQPTDRMPQRDVIRQALKDALAELVKEDDVLLSLGPSGAHELAHVHRFGVYLERRLKSWLADWTVTIDMDYDYHGKFKKTFSETPWLARADRDKEREFRPDLIIHHRGEDERNVLVLEWKKHAGPRSVEDTRSRLLQIRRQLGYVYLVMVNSFEDRAEWCFVEDADGDLQWDVIQKAGADHLPAGLLQPFLAHRRPFLPRFLLRAAGRPR